MSKSKYVGRSFWAWYWWKLSEHLESIRNLWPTDPTLLPIGFAQTSRLSHYEKQVLRLVRALAEKSLRRNMRRRLMRQMPIAHPQFLSECLPELASLAGSGRSQLLGTKVAQIVTNSVRSVLVDQLNQPMSIQQEVAAEVAQQMLEQASILDVRLRMPPVREDMEKQPRLPLSPREQRAMAAVNKYRQWKRKAALAKTKLAAYRKRVNYYKKKGLVANEDGV